MGQWRLQGTGYQQVGAGERIHAGRWPRASPWWSRKSQMWRGCWEEPWCWANAGVDLCSSTSVSGTRSTHRPDAVSTEEVCVGGSASWKVPQPRGLKGAGLVNAHPELLSAGPQLISWDPSQKPKGN